MLDYLPYECVRVAHRQTEASFCTGLPHSQSAGQSFGIHLATHGLPHSRPAGQSCRIHLPAQEPPKCHTRGQQIHHIPDITWTRHWLRACTARPPFGVHLPTQRRPSLTPHCRRPPTPRPGQTPVAEILRPKALQQHSIKPPPPTPHPSPQQRCSPGRQQPLARQPPQPLKPGIARSCCSPR